MPSSAFRRRNAAIAFIFVTVVLDIVAMGIVIPVLPKLIEQFTGSSARAGVINGVLIMFWALMQFVASPIIGSLSDQYGRRLVILVSTAGLVLDYALMALAPNLWWLALGRLIAGATSSNLTTAYAYMADITAPEERARAYGLIGAAFSSGFVVGPLLGGALGEISPRAPFWAAGALSAVALLYGLVLLPESLPRDRRTTFSWRRANPFGALRLLRSHHELFGLSVVVFLLYFANYMYHSVFVLYAGYRYGWGAWEVGAVLAFVGVLDVTVQSWLVGRFTRRIGDRNTMIWGLFGGAAGIALMGLAPTGMLFTLTMIPGALWGLAMPTVQSLMTQHVSQAEQGQLQGALASLTSIAGIVSPVFFGAVYSASIATAGSASHPGASFLIAALVQVMAGILGWRVARRVVSA